MRKYVGIGVAWLAATALSVLIASAAVAGIRDRVVETPVAAGAPTTSTTNAGGVSSTETPTTAPAATSSSTTTTSTTDAPVTTSTILDSSTTEPPENTTTTTTATATTTTTSPPQTTTTVALTYQVHTLIGGTVTLEVGDGVVRIVSAVPNAGFDADIEKNGPSEVEVDFESNTHKSELSAKFEGGELKVEKEEEPRDGEDD